MTKMEKQREGKGQKEVGREARRKSEVGLKTESKWEE